MVSVAVPEEVLVRVAVPEEVLVTVAVPEEVLVSVEVTEGVLVSTTIAEAVWVRVGERVAVTVLVTVTGVLGSIPPQFTVTAWLVALSAGAALFCACAWKVRRYTPEAAPAGTFNSELNVATAPPSACDFHNGPYRNEVASENANAPP